MTRQLISILLLATLFSFAPPAQLAESGNVAVRLVISPDNRSASSIASALREALDARGIASSVHALDQFNSLDTGERGLLVSIGNASSQRLQETHPQSSRLSLGTRRSGDAPSYAHLNIAQPFCRQLALITALSDDIRRVSMIASTTDRFAADEPRMRRCAKRHGLELKLVIKREQESVNSVLRRALDTDALLALPDPAIYNRSNIRNVLLLSYRKRIPVIGFSEAFVSAGALAALYSTPELIAIQAASIIEGGLQAGRFDSTLYQPDSYEMKINRFVSKSLGIEIPSDAQLRSSIDEELRDE